MSNKFYVNLNRSICSDKTKRQLVMILNELVTYLIALIYFICLIVLIIHHEFRQLFLAVLTPVAGFVIARFFRVILRHPRPYQVIRIRPLDREKKTSFAFPSCHVASAFVIGTTLLALSFKAAGILVLILGVVLAVLRVMSGGHFIKDVVSGALLGSLCGIVLHLIY